MARRIESAKAMQSGIVTDVEAGHAIRLLPVSKQFDTRTCARCAGLLVTEWYYDLHYTGEHKVEPLRCVQCGHRVDPVILQNQIRLPVMRHSVQQVRKRDSLKTDTFAQKA